MPNLENWREEKQSAYLYRVMAEREHDQARRSLFTALAQAADEQAQIWVEVLRDHGREPPPTFSPALRVRIVALLVRAVGVRPIKPVLAAMKVRGISVYSGVRPAAVASHPMPTSVEDFGHRHRGVESGGNLRAAVFGVNDGLVSNVSLVMGVAGATSNEVFVYISGIAGLLAGAFSMAAGEYISMRSQRELYEYQIGLERQELEQYPEEEAEELALIYNARGIPMDHARQVASELMRDPESALDTLAREELGLNPDQLGSPWGAAVSSFVAFAAGALVPLLPFIFGFGGTAAAAGVTLLALFGVGAVLSLFTGRPAWFSGLRMALIGAGAGAATYTIGWMLGVAGV